MRRAPLPSLKQLLDSDAHHLTLPEDVSHYLGHVLRLDVGEEVELFDGEGLCVRARITHAAPAIEVDVLQVDTVERAANLPRIHLVSAIPKGDRWEWMIEKATELGVHAIHPLQTERSVVQIPAQKAAKKQQRWEQIAQGAARQSHRVLFPSISPQQKIDQLLSSLHEAECATDAVHLIASIHHEHISLAQALEERRVAKWQEIYLWTGPEGGWSTEELERFERLEHVRFVSLGPRVLRAETAAIAMLSITQFTAGDLSHQGEPR